MTLTAAEVLRDYEVDGVPSSGNHQVKKSDFRTWGASIENAIAAAGGNIGTIYQTRAALFADLTRPANTMAWVVVDPTVAYNGVYQKVGAANTGSWTRVSDLPYNFIVAADVGAGTPNAIQLTTSLPVSENMIIVFSLFEDTTAAPVTISINGGPLITLKTNRGTNASALTAGMDIWFRLRGSEARMLNDQDAAALVAQMEDLLADAGEILTETEAARDEALSAAGEATGRAMIYPPSPAGSPFDALLGGVSRRIANLADAIDPQDAVTKSQLGGLLPGVNVKLSFGAVGNGTTDDTAAFQAAIASGRSLVIPAGTYKITTALIPAANTMWVGEGCGKTILKGGGTNKVIERIESSHLPTMFNIAMRDFTVDANALAGPGVHFAYLNDLFFSNMEFIGASGSNTLGVGLKIEECYIWMAQKCRFRDNAWAGIHLPKGTKNLTGANNGVIHACDFIGNNFASSFGVIGDTVQNLLIGGGCDFEGSSNGNKAIDLRNCEGVSIRDNYIELWVNGAIALDGGNNKRFLIEGNVIHAASTYICDLNGPGGSLNSNIEFRKNRFADATGAQTCVRIGNAFDVVFGGDDPASGAMCDKYPAAPKAGGILTQTVSYTVPVIAGHDGTTTTVTVAGARPGDPVQVGFATSPASVQWGGNVTANNTVTVTANNTGSGSTSSVAGTLTVAVRKIH